MIRVRLADFSNLISFELPGANTDGLLPPTGDLPPHSRLSGGLSMLERDHGPTREIGAFMAVSPPHQIVDKVVLAADLKDLARPRGLAHLLRLDHDHFTDSSMFHGAHLQDDWY